MFSKIYIIGAITDVNSVSTQNKFIEAQRKLEKLNMLVFNPIETLLKRKVSKEEAIKYNLKSLLNANAVYVLKDSGVLENSVEILMALKLNLLIMHEC